MRSGRTAEEGRFRAGPRHGKCEPADHSLLEATERRDGRRKKETNMNTRGFASAFLLTLLLLRPCDSLSVRTSPLGLAISKRGLVLQMVSENNVYVPTDLAEKLRIDVYLSTIVKGRSRSFLGELCEKGLVTVNGKQVSKSYKVCNGDVLSFEIEEKAISKLVPENIPLNVLFEDDDIIAVNKPQGMVVHPAPGSPNGTFVNALLYHLGPAAADRLLEGANRAGVKEEDEEDDYGENEFLRDSLSLDLPETPEAAVATHTSLRPGVVHRLDKGTSGVLLAGKRSETVAMLSALFAARKVSKVYLAICVGHPGDATITGAIGRSQKNRQMMTVYPGPPLGKPAVSHVKTLAFDGKLSVALVRIETGRTHQIRVHLKDRRTPIAGDDLYGNSDWNKKLAKSDGIRRPLLHAYEIQLEHPLTAKLLTLRAPLPPDFLQMVNKISASPLLDTHGLLLGTEGYGVSDSGSFVPMDRIVIEEGHWTEQELPEEV